MKPNLNFQKPVEAIEISSEQEIQVKFIVVPGYWFGGGNFLFV
jgi:hypothetical protein